MYHLISNTLPQLEQSSLHPSTVLHHRHLLQTTCYNHLLLLLHFLSSRKENPGSNRLGTPLKGGGGEMPEGPSGPSTHHRIYVPSLSSLNSVTVNSGGVNTKNRKKRETVLLMLAKQISTPRYVILID